MCEQVFENVFPELDIRELVEHDLEVDREYMAHLYHEYGEDLPE